MTAAQFEGGPRRRFYTGGDLRRALTIGESASREIGEFARLE